MIKKNFIMHSTAVCAKQWTLYKLKNNYSYIINKSSVVSQYYKFQIRKKELGGIFFLVF